MSHCGASQAPERPKEALRAATGRAEALWRSPEALRGPEAHENGAEGKGHGRASFRLRGRSTRPKEKRRLRRGCDLGI